MVKSSAATAPASEKARSAGSILTGLLTGLGWGLLFGFWEGLPLLLEKSTPARWGLRLLALAYGTAVHALVLALLGGGLGLVAALLLFLGRRPANRVRQVAIGSGLAAFLILGLSWGNRFDLLQEREGAPLGRAVLGCFALLFGLVVGVAVYGLGKRGLGRWGKALVGALPALLLLLIPPLLIRGAIHASAGTPSPLGPAPEQPNILLITIDSLRADYLGAYGYEGETSPHLDALARRGVLFENAVAPSSWSRPSTAALMTSLYPSALEIACRPWHRCTVAMDPMRSTLAEVLREAGYRTAAFVANPWLTADETLGQGFEQFEGPRPALPYQLERMEREQALLAATCAYLPAGCDLFRQGHRRLFDPALSGDRIGPLQNQLAGQFLRRHRQEAVFLWLHYGEPHLPHNTQPVGPVPEGDGRSKWLRLWDLGFQSERYHLNPGDDQALRAFYAGEVRDVDALVGDLLSMLEQLDLTERTLIIVTADHGEELGEHGEFTYGHTLYEEIVHVPLIVSGPIVRVPGSRVSTPVSLVDLLPTLAEVAAGSALAEAQGRTLRPALEGSDLPLRPVYAEGTYRVMEEWKMVRLGGEKLLYRPGTQEVELYDLVNDPGEQRNLSQVEEGKGSPLLEELEQWMEQCRQFAANLPRSAPPADLDLDRRGFIHDRGY